MKKNHRILTLALAISLAAGVALADQEDLEDMIDAAFDAVAMTKYEQEGDDELSEREESTVKRNTRRQIKRHFDDRGNPDDDAEHFVNSVNKYDSEDFHDHTQTCPVCNPFVNRLLASTSISRIPFFERRSCDVATHCFTNYGTCMMGVATLRGSQCYCPSWTGTVYGQTGCL